MTAIGVMGGTFDPIHIGHLAIAEEAREALALESVLFVPAGQPPHKPAGSVTAVEHRLAMVQLAIADNPAFELSRIEVERPGPSYTVDTVEALARGADDLVLILSAETFAELPSWHEPERLFDAARMAVVPREGYPAPDPAWLAAGIPGAGGARRPTSRGRASASRRPRSELASQPGGRSATSCRISSRPTSPTSSSIGGPLRS